MAFNSGSPFPGARALLPVLGTAAVLVAGAAPPPKGGALRVLTTRPFQHVGRLSYSWYLWHWPVLVLGAAMVPSLALTVRMGLALAALCIAALSFSAIETPVRFSRYLVARPLATVGLAAGITLTTAGVARFAKATAIRAADTPEERAIATAREAIPAGLAASGCFENVVASRYAECAFGDTNAPTTIVLFGDSHAAQWFDAFEAIANRERWRLIALTKAGCPSGDVDVLIWNQKRRPYPECGTWRHAAVRRIVDLKPALVIISNADAHVTRPDSAGLPRIGLEQWRNATRRTLQILDGAGISTVILRDTPGPGIDVPTCLSRAAVRRLPAQRCDVPRRLAIREDVFRVSKEAAGGLSHVSWLDLTDEFCTPEVCPAVLGGSIVYSQPSHIAHRFGRTLADTIAHRIEPIVKATPPLTSLPTRPTGSARTGRKSA
jgi:hypothetical protein